MKTKLDVDTDAIVNKCAVSAKNSHGKISAFHITLRRPFAEALHLQPGDLVDLAILQVEHQNQTLPNPTPDVVQSLGQTTENPVLQGQPGETSLTPPPGEPQIGSRQEGLQSMYRETSRTRAKKRGKKGGSKGGKRGSHKTSKRAKA